MSLFSRRARRAAPNAARIEQLEVKRNAVAQATRQWLDLLRELEGEGKTNEAQYETYFEAYVKSRNLEKRVDLELFNLRQGHAG